MSLSRRRFVEAASLGAVAAGLPAAAARAWILPPPGPVRYIENTWIPLSDGERLAVSLWLPEGAAARATPTVLEYIPYRKRDRYRAYGAFWGPQLARHGIAYARVDLRGSGDSSGVLVDEYLPLEQADAVAVIAWLAEQPWCNGAVGMRGVSWGGFNTLQVAALAPPALKAIMPMCATVMRYRNDAHYVGGFVGLTDLKWAAGFKLVMAAPPDPAIMGPDWAAAWRRRLEAAPPIHATWLRHPRNDAYWRQGSVATDYAAIRCPVYVVGGLVDAYSETIPRLLEHLTGPRKALIGPWQHGYPAPATPGPGLDWAWEEVRWWKQWLAGVETGIMDEPMLGAFLPHATATQTGGGALPGAWVAETAWPAPNVASARLWLNADGLAASPGPEKTVDYRADRLVGLTRPEWIPYAPSELPSEQSPDDRLSLCFDGAPLAAELDILGEPRVTLRLACDRPVAGLALRLNEVTPDGRSWPVAWGLLNLTRRHGDSEPAALVPGQACEVVVPLGFVAHRFSAGSRLRLAISESLWPLVWPTPEVATLTLTLGVSHLDLPRRQTPAVEAAFPIPITPAASAPPPGGPVLEVSRGEDGLVAWESAWPPTQSTVADTNTVLTGAGPDARLTIRPGDPERCVWRVTQSSGYQREGWDCAIESVVELRATRAHFLTYEKLTARRDGEVVFEREHRETIPRDLM